MEILKHNDTETMGSLIIYIRSHRLEFLKLLDKDVFLSLKNEFILHSAAFHLGLHCLPNALTGFLLYKKG